VVGEVKVQCRLPLHDVPSMFTGSVFRCFSCLLGRFYPFSVEGCFAPYQIRQEADAPIAHPRGRQSGPAQPAPYRRQARAPPPPRLRTRKRPMRMPSSCSTERAAKIWCTGTPRPAPRRGSRKWCGKEGVRRSTCSEAIPHGAGLEGRQLRSAALAVPLGRPIQGSTLVALQRLCHSCGLSRSGSGGRSARYRDRRW